jgi:hypothetical protein
MEAKLEALGGKLVENDEDLTHYVRYAIWYLRWVAKDGVGMDAWY